MFRLGLITAAYTLIGFVSGLPWGAEGVAMALVVTTMTIQPLRWWYLGRVGPVHFTDFAKIQIPHLIAASLVYAAAHGLRLIGMGNAALIAYTILVAYVVTVLCMLPLQSGRSTLTEIIHTSSSFFRKITGRVVYK